MRHISGLFTKDVQILVPAGFARRFVGNVDLVTGACVLPFDDICASGPFPLEWRRLYNSSLVSEDRGLGPGFGHGFDESLVLTDEETIFVSSPGLEVRLPRFERDGDRHARMGVLVERVEGARFKVSTRRRPGAEHRFSDIRQPSRLTNVLLHNGWIRVRYRSSGKLAALQTSDGRALEVEWTSDHISRVLLRGADDSEPSQVARYTYSDRGFLCESHVEGIGGHRYEYDAMGRLSSLIDGRGYAERFEYDAEGRCCAVGCSDGVDALRLQYYPDACQTVVTRADGGQWIFTYDALGVIIHLLDPERNATSFKTDEAGRVIEETDASGTVWTYSHDWMSTPTRKTANDRSVSLLIGDEMPSLGVHRVTETFREWVFGELFPAPDRLPDVYALPVDLPAPVITAIQKGHEIGSIVAETETDACGRATRTSFPDGSCLACELDAIGNPRWFDDRDGRRTTFEHDSRGLLAASTDPLGATTVFERSVAGALTGVVDALGGRTSFVTDRLERVVEVHQGGLFRERYVYDAVGNLLEKRGRGEAPLVSLQYDPERQLAARMLASGDEQRFGWSQKDELEEASNSAGELELAVDTFTKRRSKDVRDGRGVEHQFGRLGVVETSVFERFVTRYERPDHRSVTIVDPTGAAHRLENIGFGLIRCERSNGTLEITQVDTEGRCVLQALSSMATPEHAWIRRYTVSVEGDLLAVDDTMSGETRFLRDAAGRLIEIRRHDGRVERYGYDLVGNMTQAPGREMAFDESSRLLSSPEFRVDHDERGNVRLIDCGDRVMWLYYDSLDQLVGVKLSDGRRFEAEYDAMGRRTRKTFDGREWVYYWDSDRLAAEIVPGGGLRVYVYADDVAMVPLLCVDYESERAEPESGLRSFFFSDQRGCPIMVQDDRGRVVWQAAVEPHGAAHIVFGEQFYQPLRLPGYYADEELGLQTARFRSYWPELGRYLQPNPIGLAGGTTSYALAGDPLTRVCLLGLRPSGVLGVLSPGFFPELHPVAVEATADLFHLERACQHPLTAGEGGLESQRSVALSKLEDCRQLLSRDRALVAEFKDQLFKLELTWSLVSNASDEFSTYSLVGKDFEALIGDIEALQELIREKSVPTDEPPTHLFTRGS